MADEGYIIIHKNNIYGTGSYVSWGVSRVPFALDNKASN